MDVDPEFFPTPDTYRPDGNQTAKQYLLALKKEWLLFGIERLKEEVRKKTRLKKGQPDSTVEELDSEIDALKDQITEAQAELKAIRSVKHADQQDRRRILRINVKKWISELHRKGVEEGKLIGKTTGAARAQHIKNNDRYVQAEGDFEDALKDPSFTDAWK
jgi:hypothetical protein